MLLTEFYDMNDYFADTKQKGATKKMQTSRIPCKREGTAQSRRARIYKRIGGCRVTFCGKEKQEGGRMELFCKKKVSEQSELCTDVAHLTGFEPVAYRLGGDRSILLSYRCIIKSTRADIF